MRTFNSHSCDDFILINLVRVLSVTTRSWQIQKGNKDMKKHRFLQWGVAPTMDAFISPRRAQHVCITHCR
jgi:hypothetical protein